MLLNKAWGGGGGLATLCARCDAASPMGRLHMGSTARRATVESTDGGGALVFQFHERFNSAIPALGEKARCMRVGGTCLPKLDCVCTYLSARLERAVMPLYFDIHLLAGVGGGRFLLRVACCLFIPSCVFTSLIHRCGLLLSLYGLVCMYVHTYMIKWAYPKGAGLTIYVLHTNTRD